ncbi:8-oxo-dGTP diphosphatase [Arthrobacter castelli]|uniref:8-oxo-dGTP diphosphatase n=1 Tax=Arthrobacter castelli TaxID=271431 RepID=UPI00041C4441|nr:8-oxo-dGTP diphosphatase [Arthrobacter castelli]
MSADAGKRPAAAAIALCFLLRTGETGGRQVLMGRKKRGFGVGKMVGLGGHVEPGESVAEAACREVAEESSVAVRQQDLNDVGTVEFVFPARPQWNMSTRVFTASVFAGVPVETDEIEPHWFALDDLPVSHMWQDAEHWLPPMLSGRRLAVTITLRPDNETVAEVYLEELAALAED